MIGSVGHNHISNNKSGFSAKPGGAREANGEFWGAYLDCYFWTSSPGDHKKAFSLRIKYDDEGIYMGEAEIGMANSIRLVRDAD